MSSYQQRPKPANIEDRDEAQATLETLLEEDSDITWVQFRYRVIRGGAGLARSEELAGTKGVDRDLSSLTLEEAGSNGIAELREELPPHEVAYVLYNNTKGTRREDVIRREQQLRDGSCWRRFFALQNFVIKRFVREHLHFWAALVETNAKEVECKRLLGLTHHLNIYVPGGAPTHDPVKTVEFICKASPPINGVYIRALEKLFDMAEDPEYTVLQATGEVAKHLEKLHAADLAKAAEEERLKQEKVRQRRIQQKKREAVLAAQKAAAERHAEKFKGKATKRRGARGFAAGSEKPDELELDGLVDVPGDQTSVVSINSARRSETQFTEFSDETFDDEFLWDDSTLDARSMVSNRESPLQSPTSRMSRGTSVRKQDSFASSPLRSPERKGNLDSPLQSPLQRGESMIGLPPVPGGLAEEVSSSFSRSLKTAGLADDDQSLGQFSREFDGMEWDEANFEDRQEAEDAYFQWTIEEEARRLAIVMERSALTMQALARGYRDRQRVRRLKAAANDYWDEKLLKARYHHVIVVLVWTPESTSIAMREMPLYHVRDVLDLLNDAASASQEAKQQEQLALVGATSTADGKDGVLLPVSLQESMASVTSMQSSTNNESGLQVLEGMLAQQKKEKESLPLIPNVVHRAKTQERTTPIWVAKTIAVNYFGGDADSDDSDDSDDAFVVHFGEQELYQELLNKYGSFLELPGDSRTEPRDTLEWRRAWAERLETKSLRMARAKHRAQRDILRRRKLLAGHALKPSRQRSRMLKDVDDKQDVCNAILTAAQPRVSDLKHKFLHKAWWTITFPTRDRDAPPQDLSFSDDGPVQDAAKSQDWWHDEDAALAKSRSLALSRIAELSCMDSPRMPSRLSATSLWYFASKEQSSAKEKAASEAAREPSLKSSAAQPVKLSIITASELKEFYAIKCKALQVEQRQDNLQGFMHSIAKGCTNTCFNLVDMGIESTSLNFLLKNLTNKVISLTELNLARNPLRDAGATELSEFLQKNRTLTVLNLESANIGANGQAALFTTLAKHNFRITTLLLGGSGATTMKNVLGEAGALAAGAAMHSNSTLATLSLADNRLTSAQLQVFSKGLRSNIQLTSLDLSNNVFGDEGVHLLAASLETLQLTYLNLARTEMTDAGACSLAQAVATGRPPIHTLCLSGNRVAAGGAAALTAVIARKNTVLNTLKLDHNNLGPVGMKNMLEKSIYTTTLVKDKHGRPVDVVVHYPRALTDLNLSANGLLDEGAKFAAELMIENSVLTKLDISHNGIGNKGMREIGKALGKNTTLVSLALGSNVFTNQGVANMVETSELRGHLTDLDLSGNRLNEGVGESLLSFAHACTALIKLNLDETFLTHQENDALTAMLARNVGMLPKNKTDAMKEEVQRLEELAVIADDLQAQLAAEKKDLLKVNATIEMMRQKTSKQREDGINEYIRTANSISQAKITISSNEEKLRELERDMNFKAREYDEKIAARSRTLNIELEGKAWQLSLQQNLRREIEHVQTEMKTQMQHRLNDLEALCSKQEFAIKKQQKFRNDILELLREDEQYLDPRAAEAAWNLLGSDPTLAQEERMQGHRANIANRLLALETREQNKEGMLRAARRAAVMYKQCEGARKQQEGDGPMSKVMLLLKKKEETATDKTRKLLKRMSIRRPFPRTGSISRTGSADSNSMGNMSRLSQSVATPASLSRDVSRDLRKGSPTSLSHEGSRDQVGISRETSRDPIGLESPLSQTTATPAHVGTDSELVGIKQGKSGSQEEKSRKSPARPKGAGKYLGDDDTGGDREVSNESVSPKKKKSVKGPKQPSTTLVASTSTDTFLHLGGQTTEPEVLVSKAQTQVLEPAPIRVPWSMRRLDSMLPGSKLTLLPDLDRKQSVTSAPTASGPAIGVLVRQETMHAEDPALGLKWQNVGKEKPYLGTEISNKFLAAGLRGKSEFTKQEFDAFRVSHLTYNSYVKVDDDFFKPEPLAAPADPADHVEAIMGTKGHGALAKGKGKGKRAKTEPSPSHAAALDSNAAHQPQEGQEGVENGPADAASVPRRHGPTSLGMCGPSAVRTLLKGTGKVDTSIMRGLLDVQQRYLMRVNYEKGAWIAELEKQKEQRSSLGVGFMEGKRIRRLAEIAEILGKEKDLESAAAKLSRKGGKKEHKK